MNNPDVFPLASFDPQRDLQHFLTLAAAQAQSRLRKLEAETSHPDLQAAQKEIWRLRTLAELIKEQIPNHEQATR